MAQTDEARGEAMGAGSHSPTARVKQATSHSPLPWRSDIGDGSVRIRAANGMCVALGTPAAVDDDDDGSVNAALIVHRVNVHDELLAALKALTTYVDVSPDLAELTTLDVDADPLLTQGVAIARAAIALAEGKEGVTHDH